jgi:hypothetical protein
MADNGGAYEHDSTLSGFGGGSGKAPFTGNAGAADDAGGSRNEIEVKGRQQADKHHGPETHQDTRTAPANPKMHDLKTTARDADPDIE